MAQAPHAASTITPDDVIDDIRSAVRDLCARFPGPYWREKDRERAYPKEFVQALTDAGYLAALIPEEYGGSGLGLRAAGALLTEIHKNGCNGAACPDQMEIIGTLPPPRRAHHKRNRLPGATPEERRGGTERGRTR